LAAKFPDIVYFSTFDIFHILAVAVQLPLIAVLLYKGRRSLSNQLMAVFFFAQVLNSLAVLCWSHYNETFGQYPFLAYLAVPFFAVWGPTMYLYIQAETIKGFSLKWKHYLHFLPFFLCALYFLFAYHFHSSDEKMRLLQTGEVYDFSYRKIFSAFIAIQVFVYNVLAIYRIEEFGRNHPLKSGSALRRFRWNRFIIYGYFLVCLCNNIASWIYPLTNEPRLSNYFFISVVLFFLYFSVVLIGALLGSHFGEPALQANNQSLPHDLADTLHLRLTPYMNREKPYLECNLTLAELAAYLGLKERHLSEYINSYCHTTFQDYVNRFRIEEAKKLLTENTSNRKSILEIAFEAGFNSKSTFNYTFRKHTRTTPSNYRKEATARAL